MCFQLYVPVFSMSWYGYGTCDIVHWSAAPHNRIANWTDSSVYVVLVLYIIRYSCHYFLDRILFHYDFHHDSCDYHWDFYGHWLSLDLYFGLPSHGWFWFCRYKTPWRFLPHGRSPWVLDWTCFLLDSFMSCLHSLLGYSIGEFQALQLIVLVAFGAVD